MLDEAEAAFKIAATYDSLLVYAYTGLGKVEFYRRPSRIIPFERLKQLLKKDHKSKAIKKFNQALTINPNYIPALYFRARTYFEKEKIDDLEMAKTELTNLYEKYPDYLDVLYYLAYSHQKLNDLDQALKLFSKIKEEDSDYAKANIRLAEIYYDKKKYTLSTKSYFIGIDCLEDKDTFDFLYDELSILLSPQEKTEFETAAFSEKRKLIKKFWIQRDPDPDKLENKRLMEHFRRVRYAKKYFHFTVLPYYDDRGKIYIKYGEPDSKYKANSGAVEAKDNESWSYESVEEGLVFDFVSEGGYYKEVKDLTEAALAGKSYDARLSIASSLYEDRSHLSNSYAKLAANFSIDRLTEYNRDRETAVYQHPGSIYKLEKNIKTFPFLTKIAQFKGENKKTRIECYTSLPGFAIDFRKADDKFINYTEYFIEIFDDKYDSKILEDKKFSIIVNSLENIKGRQFLFQENYQLNSGEYDIAFVVSDDKKNMKGVQRKKIQIRDFASDELMLSDLQLSSKVEVVDKKSNGNFIKNGLKVSPYTFSSVVKKNPIYLYFEIYNLSFDEQKNSSFEVFYTLKTIKPDRNAWQKTFGSISRLFSGKQKNVISTQSHRTGDTETAFEYIAFDLKNLEKGLTKLTVKINDLISKQEVEREIEFNLID